jgi:NADP-dependent 3-hydroxy acid dehydrogenase YdfG
VECDVTDSSSIARAIAVIRDAFGGAPDVLVNNAGLFAIRAIEETSASELDSLIATNLTAPFTLVREFLPGMRARGSGHIVTIGSVADRHIFAGNAAYSATKYGTRALHEVLREETRGSGVRATLISPASVDTDIWDPIQYLGTDAKPDRSGMLPSTAVAEAILFAVTQPANVNIDELRLSRA